MVKAFNEGYQAYLEGIKQCPYGVETYERFFWNNGWDCAKKEAK